MVKFRSFTIIELVVVLLIGSIVSSLLYFGLLAFSKTFEIYRRTNSFVMDSYLFNKILRLDVENAVIVTAEGDDLVCRSPEKSENIVYRFGKDYVVREFKEQSDTFKMNTVTKRYLRVSQTDCIESLLFEFTDGKASMPISLHKEYAASALISRQIRDND